MISEPQRNFIELINGDKFDGLLKNNNALS